MQFQYRKGALTCLFELLNVIEVKTEIPKQPQLTFEE